MALSTFLHLIATCSLAGLGQATAGRSLNGTRGGAMLNNTTHPSKTSTELLTIPLKRVDHRGVATPSLAKRFFKTDVLGIYGAAYVGELTIGNSSKPQVVDVLLDTGSFELWVNPDCARSNVPQLCSALGRYDPALSSTSQNLGGDFSIKYGSGGTSGTYYKDDIYISGIQIKDQQFGVSNSSDLVWFGIMGLGHGQGNGFINYPLVVDSLSAQGLTNSKLFSLDLGAQVRPSAAVTGEIVFGGVNTNKYSGNLAKVPTDPSDPHYVITLNTLSHRAPGASSPGTASTPILDASLPLRVVVDSGTTLSLLPEPVVRQLAAQFPGAAPDGNGGYTVPCALQDDDGAVDFGFLTSSSGNNGNNATVTISVRYRDFVWNSGGECFLGAWYTDDIGVWILGDTFLRGAYVTFDQSNNALYMANYVSCSDEPNLVAVPAGPDAGAQIPGSCQVGAVAAPSAAPSSVTPASLPGGSVSSTAIPSAVSSLGPTVNPIGPATSSSSSSSSLSSPTPSRTTPSSSLSSISASSSGSRSPTRNPSSSLSPSSSPVSLNDDPATTTLAPAQQKGGKGNIVGAAGTTTTTGTITTTITRSVVYTVTACPASARDCSLGAVSTSLETIVTTACPEDEKTTANAPAPTRSATTTTNITRPTAAAPPIAVPAPARAGSSVGAGEDATGDETENETENTATNTNDYEAPNTPTIPASAATAPAAPVTQVVTEHCSTSTYTITSCGPSDDDAASCTVGATTTRVVTLYETLEVRPLPTAAAFAPGSGSGSGLNSSMGVAGQSACVSCVNNGYAATGGVPVTAGARGSGLGSGTRAWWAGVAAGLVVGLWGVVVI
ncbi:acid protease [Xylariaceae sp. FL0662B]|nr:acid protease [Xylariaceae sp. FL0662B]